MTSSAAADPAFEDLTARARIREAAIRLFTERGVEATAILDIAKAAGVSGGLIRHHFGSKEGLREFCDTYVFNELVRFKEQVLENEHVLENGQADLGFLPTFDARQVALRRYLGRAMIDGSPAAASKFGDIVDQTERWFVERSGLGLPDPRAAAAVLAGMTIGVLALQDHIARALGADPLSPDLQLRIALASAEIYNPAWLPPAVIQQVKRQREGQDHD